MEHRHIENGVEYIIDFNLTGEVYDVIDCYDKEEGIEGVDQFGNEWSGSASVSCEEVVEILEIEKE